MDGLVFGCILQIFIISNSYALNIKKGFLNTYPEDCTYKGQLKNKIPHGKGKLKCETFKVIGSFKDGITTGKIKYFINKYEKDGYAIALLKNFKLHGKVKFYTSNGRKVAFSHYNNGKIIDDSFMEVWNPENQSLNYKGQNKNKAKHGYGESYHYLGPNKGALAYKGQWENNKKHGFGIDYNNEVSNGTIYGEWENGRNIGFVKIMVNGELSYIGDYNDKGSNGGKNGYGKWINRKRNISYFGYWKKAELNGITHIDDGIVDLIAMYKNHKVDKSFPVTKVTKDKKKHLTKYNEKDNESTGLIKKDDQIYTGELLNDIPHGHGILKDYKTRKKIVGLFDNGELVKILLEIKF